VTFAKGRGCVNNRVKKVTFLISQRCTDNVFPPVQSPFFVLIIKITADISRVVRLRGARWRGAPLILTTERFFIIVHNFEWVERVSEGLYRRVFASAVRLCLETLCPMHCPESGTDVQNIVTTEPHSRELNTIVI
jgi:hypothetical protein